MALSDTIKAVAVAAYAAVAGTLESVIYNHVATNPGYTPATGVVSTSETAHTVSVLIEDVETHEISNENILPTDIKASLPANNLSVTPNTKGTITRDSIDHEIVGLKTDPAQAVWTFFLRAP